MSRFILRWTFAALAIISLSLRDGFAQDMIGVGASGIYNFKANNFGLGLRVHIPVKERWAVVPQVSFFPSTGYFGGVSAHYNLFMRTRYIFYLSASGHLSVSVKASANVNANSSSQDASLTKSGKMNASGDAGAGLLFGKRCLRPFAEGRYNPLLEETSAHLGVLWFPQCSSSPRAPRNKSNSGSEKTKKKKSSACPAYR
jgi:hypothetical protein